MDAVRDSLAAGLAVVAIAVGAPAPAAVAMSDSTAASPAAATEARAASSASAPAGDAALAAAADSAAAAYQATQFDSAAVDSVEPDSVEPDSAAPDSAVLDSATAAAPVVRGDGALGLNGRSRYQPPSVQLNYSSYPHSFTGSYLRDVQLNRFDAGLMGADRGAFACAALGFLGTQTGITSQGTSWTLMGIGAVLGALWGSTRPAEDRGVRILIEPERWGPREMLRYDARDREP